MRRHTSLLVALLALLCSFTAAVPAAAAETTSPHRITFPVIGSVRWTDTFGAPRSGGRSHEGTDLMGAKMLELVAADSGVVTYLNPAGALSGGMLTIKADNGWSYSYLHLNNDTPGTDDGRGTRDQMFGPGIVKGARVTAGQLIGYLGDSGNAESTGAHLHFEMESPSGAVVNPTPWLQAASRPAQAVGATPSPIERLAGQDRVATAVAVSVAGWPNGAPEVVLAAGDRYGEALPASVLAAARRGPLLLSAGDTLARPVLDELDRLKATKVTVVGSVPKAVADAVAASGRTVQRIGVVDDATATAVAVAAAVGGAGGTAVLVNGDRFADGVSATAIAAGRGWPVLLTSSSTVAQRTVDAWRALGVRRLLIVGGTSVVGGNVEHFARTAGRCGGAAGCTVERLAGPDRYATSVAVVERSLVEGGRSAATVLLGTGTSYADVLASGPLASQLGGLSLLVDGSGAGADAASRSFLAAKADTVQRVSILGGDAAVGAAADRALQSVLGLG